MEQENHFVHRLRLDEVKVQNKWPMNSRVVTANKFIGLPINNRPSETLSIFCT